MKIATWNVNGIRARAAQVCEFIEKEQPDVLCLQELKANVDQVPLECRVTDYHIYWHGSTLRAYAGVSLHIKDRGAKPAFTHPAFDMESRIVAAEADGTVFASVYVPNGGKDFPAKVHFLERMRDWVKHVHAEGKSLVLCGDINIARTERDVHPAERKNVIGQLPEERALSMCSAASIRTTSSFSPGGRRGARCASATSAGGWTTSSPRSQLQSVR